MLNQIRHFNRLLAPQTRILTSLSSFQFCSPSPKDKNVYIPEDWEYCRLISSELRQNNINKALSFVFQSYFNNQVLDIQVFNSVFEKINELKMPLSYAEILYEIYREHFKPNLMILNWMEKLTTSSNEGLIDRLRKDYESINQSYPLRTIKNMKKGIKSQKKELDPELEKTKVDEKNEGEVASEAEQTTSRSKKHESRSVSKQNPDIEIASTSAQKSQPQDISQFYSSPEFQKFSRLINNLFEERVKEKFRDISQCSLENIVIHDLEIDMKNFDQMAENELEEEEEDAEFEEENNEYARSQDDVDVPTSLMDFLGLDISRIKVGRIELKVKPLKRQ